MKSVLISDFAKANQFNRCLIFDADLQIHYRENADLHGFFIFYK